jgi:hypothetical protein
MEVPESTDKDTIHWILMIMYINEMSRSTRGEFAMLMSSDKITVNMIANAFRGRSRIPASQQRNNRTLIKNNYSILEKIINSQRLMIIKQGSAGSERETSSVPGINPFVWIHYYGGFSSHFKECFDKVVITAKMVTDNPWRQAEYEWIIRWMRQLKHLDNEQVLALYLYLLYYKEKSVSRDSEESTLS